jgi:glutamate---cysteine ligase / carboxylate-amine ligase
MHQSVVEIGTGICRNIQEAKAEIRDDPPRQIVDLARANGCASRPAARIPSPIGRNQEIYPDERYHTIVEDMKMVARANLIFGLHVHIGVEDRETAIQIMNGARYFLPHILALSTNSPFWHGHGYRLRSYRCKVFDKFPRTNIPDVYFPAGRVRELRQLLIRTNCIDNAKKIWWDIRPHPHFPTLEFRICDMPMRLMRPSRIAALCQAVSPSCTSCTSRISASAITPRADHGKQVARRALRHGRQTDRFRQAAGSSGARADRREYLEFVDDVVDELGSREEIAYIASILEEGTGADRQLRVFP